MVNPVISTTQINWASNLWMTGSGKKHRQGGWLSAALITGSGKSTRSLCVAFFLSAWLYLSLSLSSSDSDNSSRLSNCMFEWSYIAGWNLQSDTDSVFLSLQLICLFIHTTVCHSNLACLPHRALPPVLRIPQASLLYLFPVCSQSTLQSQWGLGSITTEHCAVIDVIVSFWADYSWELLIAWPGVV